MKPTIKTKLVRVIVDSRDSKTDKWIPESIARALYLQGKLSLVECYNNQWDYATG